jgi:hypothetical protein
MVRGQASAELLTRPVPALWFYEALPKMLVAKKCAITAANAVPITSTTTRAFAQNVRSPENCTNRSIAYTAQ